MERSYAVVWRDGDGPRFAGCLRLGRGRLWLSGYAPCCGSLTLEVPYAELSGHRIGRSDGERLAGARSLVLERRRGAPIRVASCGGPGILHELADELSARREASSPRPASHAPLALRLQPGV